MCEKLLGTAQVDVLAAALQELSCCRVRTLSLWQGGLPESAALKLTAPLAAQRVSVKLCGALLDAPHLVTRPRLRVRIAWGHVPGSCVRAGLL